MCVGVQIPHSRLPHLLWLAGTLAAVMAVGLLAYYCIERPLLNMMKRWTKKPAAIEQEVPVRMAA